MISAFVVALGIVLAAVVYTKGQERWHIKPRVGKYQVAVQGRTEDSESVTISLTVFPEDSEEVVKEKLKGAFEIRESRLQFQNERLLALQAEHKAGLEKARDERLKLVEKQQEDEKLKGQA